MVTCKQYIYLIKIKDLVKLTNEKLKYIENIKVQLNHIENNNERLVETIEYINSNQPFEIDNLNIYNHNSTKNLELHEKNKDILKRLIEYRNDF